MTITKCRDCGMTVDRDDPACLCTETDAANRRVGEKILAGIRARYESQEFRDGIIAELLGRAWAGQEIHVEAYIREAE